jgi:vacuolar protein sorting-associated protein 13A/C
MRMSLYGKESPHCEVLPCLFFFFVEQKRKRRRSVQEIDFKMTANLEYFSVEIGSRKSKIATLLVKGAVAGVIVKKTNTVITAKLKDIVISDPNPATIHPTVSNVCCLM